MDIFVIEDIHPLCVRCTVYMHNGKRLAVVQERFDPVTKFRWWDSIDVEYAMAIRDAPKFKSYFESYACETDLHVISVRKLLWAVGIKRPKLEDWEISF